MTNDAGFTVTGLEEATAEMRYAVHTGVVAALTLLGVQATRQVVENIRTPYNGMPPAVASGNLANAVFPAVTPGAMFSRLLVAAGAPADTYVDAVETGARPHMPPVNALLPWVAQKFGVDDEKAALSIAWAIARSIAKRGMQGRFMFQRAQATIDTIAESAVTKQIAIALREQGFEGGAGATG